MIRPREGARLRHASGCSFALLAALCVLLGVSGAASASVRTDQASYAPGATVTISGDNSDGAGYLPGEEVSVAVTGPGGVAKSCSAVADTLGTWSCQVTLASDASAVGSYSFAATGRTSGTSQSGSFGDSGCPNSSALGNQKEDPNVRASYTAAGGTAQYSVTTPNESPVEGVPGLIEYCIYTEPQPNSAVARYSNSNGAWANGSGGGYFDFERSGGDKDNLPFDGTTQVVGEATWSSGEVPASQTIVLHINDAAECTALYGGATETCFVTPGKAPPKCTRIKGVGHAGPTGPEGLNENDNLDTCLTGTETFEATFPNGDHWHLSHLNSATYEPISGGYVFSGQGTGKLNKVSGYSATFSWEVIGKQIYFSLTIEKEGKIVDSVSHQLLNPGSRQTIS
jgi:hypothetical protein